MNIEFATQFENYLGDKQAISTALEAFMEALPETLSNEQLSPEMLTKMECDILTIVTENLSEEIEIPQQLVGNQVELVADEGLEGSKAQLMAAANGENETSSKMEMYENTVSMGADSVENGKASAGVEDVFVKMKETLLGKGATQSEVRQFQESLLKGEVLQQELLNEKTLTAPNSLGSILNEEEQEYLKGQLQVLFAEADQEYDASNINKNTSVVSVLKDIQELLAGNPQMGKKVLLEFFSGNECRALIKDALEQQWTIRPKDLEGSDKINRLYEKMERQLTRIEEIVKAAGQQENQIINLSENIRSNVEFMKQINEMYTYVQIPLKMSGQNASGQIYVYTNKKKLEKGDEDLTAFLHLDMDHLGQTDVSVRMHGKDVTTNFYMEDDASYALLKQFMPQLEARLAAKGYKCTLIVNNESKKVNFVEDFLKKDQPSAGQVRRYSFDMRA